MISEKTKRIEVKNISKTFRADFKKNEGALFRFVDFISGKMEKKEIEVLKNISFDVNAGEILGIIGRNGSGKSTLLRLIAGVYESDSGQIRTSGKVVYLTGTSQGSSPKLTMRENIYLMGSVMGLSKRDIRKRFKEIVEFSGLKDFVDMKVYQFSTGMVSRLNFSIVIHCVEHHNPDILLFDEVLSAGGDIDFQRKANEKIEDLIKRGGAVILVSHNLELLEKYCHGIALLENGNFHYYRDKTEALNKYKQR